MHHGRKIYATEEIHFKSMTEHSPSYVAFVHGKLQNSKILPLDVVLRLKTSPPSVLVEHGKLILHHKMKSERTLHLL